MDEFHSIFDVWMVCDCHRYRCSHYPLYNTEEIKIGSASSPSFAESIVKEYVKRDASNVHSYIIREIPVDRMWCNDESFSYYVYDFKGILLSERHYSKQDGYPGGEFTGWTPEEIRFKIGEIVECYWCGVMCLGVVLELPRCAKKEKGSILDTYDDCYRILFDYRDDTEYARNNDNCFVTGGDSTCDLETSKVFKPRFNIHPAVENRLKKYIRIFSLYQPGRR